MKTFIDCSQYHCQLDLAALMIFYRSTFLSNDRLGWGCIHARLRWALELWSRWNGPSSASRSDDPQDACRTCGRPGCEWAPRKTGSGSESLLLVYDRTKEGLTLDKIERIRSREKRSALERIPWAIDRKAATCLAHQILAQFASLNLIG